MCFHYVVVSSELKQNNLVCSAELVVQSVVVKQMSALLYFGCC